MIIDLEAPFRGCCHCHRWHLITRTSTNTLDPRKTESVFIIVIDPHNWVFWGVSSAAVVVIFSYVQYIINTYVSIYFNISVKPVFLIYV